MTKRLMFLLLAVVMLTPLPAFARSPKTELPEVEQLSATVPVYDPTGGIQMAISGLFERTITGTDRTAKLYVPEGAHLGAYMVVMNVPDGEETVSWLVDSGWIAAPGAVLMKSRRISKPRITTSALMATMAEAHGICLRKATT